jgi:hypothetical protein
MNNGPSKVFKKNVFGTKKIEAQIFFATHMVL